MRESESDGASLAVESAPVTTLLSPAVDQDAFLRVAGGGHEIGLGRAAADAADLVASQPVSQESGLFADYADFLPGGIVGRFEIAPGSS